MSWRSLDSIRYAHSARDDSPFWRKRTNLVGADIIRPRVDVGSDLYKMTNRQIGIRSEVKQSHQQPLPPRGRWPSAARSDEEHGRNCWIICSAKACSGVVHCNRFFHCTEFQCSSRIPHPPLRGTFSPGEGFLSFSNNDLSIYCKT